jgi:hypothetical protein
MVNRSPNPEVNPAIRLNLYSHRMPLKCLHPSI